MDYYSKIVEDNYGKLERKVCNKIVLHILFYLFRIENVTVLNKKIRILLKSKDGAKRRINVVSLRRKLLTSGYVFNLKAFLFAVVAYENKVPVKKLAIKYKIRKEDVNLVRFLSNKKLHDSLLEYTYKYKAFSLEDFKHETEWMLKEVDVRTRKFIMRKKKFIMRSFNIDLEDFVNDLMLLGIRGLIMQYPCFESQLHMLNHLKNTIHNRGINFIKYFTRNKRNATGGNRVSYDILIDGLFLPNKEKGTQTISDLAGNNFISNNIGNMENTADLEISVAQLLKSAKTEKRKLMIKLLMGKQDKDFTKWLIGKRICTQAIDNTEFQYRCLGKNKLKKYKQLVFRYLGFSNEKGERLLQKLGEQLA